MRVDTEMPPLFRGSTAWKKKFNNETFTPDEARNSFSGHERNRLFINHGGKAFSDLSTLSGLDADRDGRTFVTWDYDRDGRQDIALVNANAPLLNLFRNEISSSRKADGNRMIALRFVGANHTDQPAGDASCRDGYGAVAQLALGDMALKREHRCGEGYAAQNSRTMIIGIGRHQRAQRVSVRWPSGKTTQVENVAAGTLLTCYEDGSSALQGANFVQEPYRAESLRPPSPSAPRRVLGFISKMLRDTSRRGDSSKFDESQGRPTVIGRPSSRQEVHARLNLFMTTATWCKACSARTPQLELLRRRFDPADLALFGLPIDPADTRSKLGRYMDRVKPPYELLLELTDPHRTEVDRLLTDSGHAAIIPSSIVTDENGAVLRVFAGVPTVSELRVMLRARKCSEFTVQSSGSERKDDPS